MPVKSMAQLRKLAELVKEGKLKESQFKEWTSGVNTKTLPERVGKSPTTGQVKAKKAKGT